ncbi:hypothetical protein [Fodinicola acaciae]|uniref:hypothetical protein n=1 Tax=Fodinicola acaciae TaxID=2681555 RepID=UPI0013CF6EA3|nr:hypothetical protein [Fodinicola acaciae]
MSYNKDHGGGETRQMPSNPDSSGEMSHPRPNPQQAYTGQTTGDVPYAPADYPQRYPDQATGGVPYDIYGDDYDPADYQASGDLGYDVPGQIGTGSPQTPNAPWAPASPAAGMPASVPPAPPSNARPASVKGAVGCLIAQLAIVLLNFGLLLLTQDDITKMAIKDSTFAGFTPESVAQFVRIVVYVLGGAEVAFSLFLAVMALFVLRRRARTFTLVLAIVWLVAQIGLLAFGGVVPAGAGTSALSNALNGILILVIAAGVVMLVLPSTGRWIRNRT